MPSGWPTGQWTIRSGPSPVLRASDVAALRARGMERGSTRRTFTDAYKAEAVAFVIEGGRPVAEVARNIGVQEMTLGKWVKKERDAQAPSVPAEAPLKRTNSA